jgi:hypothetical protein
MTPIQEAAEAIAERLLIWHRLAQQCHDRGEEGEWIDLRDMWNPADQAAIDKFTEAKARAQGLRPLFREDAS